MLMHHFGSKEKLIAAVMQEAQAKLQSRFLALRQKADGADPAALLTAFWRSITRRETLPYLRLLFEVQALALQNPKRYARYLADTSGSWLRLIEPVLPRGRQRRATATLLTAVIDGLLLELLSTGDLRRTSKALDVFVAQLRGRKRR